MFDLKSVEAGLVTASFTISTLVICLLVGRTNFRQVYGWLALFFAFNALTELPSIVENMLEAKQASYVVYVLMALTLPFLMGLAPTFWLYVRTITSETLRTDLRRDLLHLTPLLAGSAISAYLLFLPWQELLAAANQPDPLQSPLVRHGNHLLLGVFFVFLVQSAAYSILIIKRLVRYSQRLKDLFSTTKGRELIWIRWLGLILLLYLLSGFTTQFAAYEMMDGGSHVHAHVELLPDILALLLFWTLAVWGLRQKPGLIDLDRSPAAVDDSVSAKYERSALMPEDMKRIAGKIENAMRTELLYRDPGLSLWMLSSRIGVSSNYVSQTLNAHLGQTFFDYVNGWRIADAQDRLCQSQDTILAIAYEVGFNSRSAFYNAFKLLTGSTPTEFRKTSKASKSRFQPTSGVK